MQVEKTYTGTAPANVSATVQRAYGLDTTVSLNTAKTDEINGKIEEFLTECGVDCHYDGNGGFLWVMGVPIHLYFVTTQVYVNVWLPYGTAVTVAGSTSAYTFFDSTSSNAYSMKLGLIGEPKSAFTLCFGVRYGGFTLSFAKAKNELNGRDALCCAWAGNGYSTGITTSAHYFWDVDEDGGLISRFSTVPSTLILETVAADVSDNPEKFPLVKSYAGIYVYENAFQFPKNFGLNQVGLMGSSGATGTLKPITVQNFYKIGGKKYWCGHTFGLVECTTEI